MPMLRTCWLTFLENRAGISIEGRNINSIRFTDNKVVLATENMNVAEKEKEIQQVETYNNMVDWKSQQTGKVNMK